VTRAVARPGAVVAVAVEMVVVLAVVVEVEAVGGLLRVHVAAPAGMLCRERAAAAAAAGTHHNTEH
jgi:hypothetical protein